MVDNNKYLPVRRDWQRVSILVPAFQAEAFIEACLDSIELQTYFKDNDNYEVLIGIDACESTKQKLNEIHHKYRNLTIIMLEKNGGTYITLNTLFGLITSDNIIIFGSDDIMRPELVNEVIYASSEADVVMMGYNAFISEPMDARRFLEYAHGAIYYKKRIIEITGGYRPWRCAADTELLQRVSKRVKITHVEKALFYRRLHDNSLTKRADTGRRSELRNEYNKLIRTYEIDENIYIKKLTGNFNEV
jgi:glycosyltransferase involved in cell wall biosynthesis